MGGEIGEPGRREFCSVLRGRSERRGSSPVLPSESQAGTLTEWLSAAAVGEDAALAVAAAVAGEC